MLYSYTLNDTTQTLKFNLSNGRGDIVAQTSSGGAIVWTASYEAYGKQTKETGTNNDTQRANSKEEDPTGLLNEGHRYRDLDTGVWLSRDPAGFVDGPNLYAYVMQNPWTAWDPDGLFKKQDYRNDMKVAKARYEAEKRWMPKNATDRQKFGMENRYKNRCGQPSRELMGLKQRQQTSRTIQGSQWIRRDLTIRPAIIKA